jgi:hypothetical protein
MVAGHVHGDRHLAQAVTRSIGGRACGSCFPDGVVFDGKRLALDLS